MDMKAGIMTNARDRISRTSLIMLFFLQDSSSRQLISESRFCVVHIVTFALLSSGCRLSPTVWSTREKDIKIVIKTTTQLLSVFSPFFIASFINKDYPINITMTKRVILTATSLVPVRLLVAIVYSRSICAITAIIGEKS